MSVSDVEQAFLTAVQTALGTTPIEWENHSIEPPSDAKWAQVFFMPNVPEVASLGDGGQNLATGIVQVSLKYPLGTGNEAARIDSQALCDLFPAGSHVTYQTQQAKIVKSGRTKGSKVDDFFVVYVTIYWYAWISR